MADTSETPDESDDRYGAIETEAGEVVIYDRDETSAWLQSTHAVEVRA